MFTKIDHSEIFISYQKWIQCKTKWAPSDHFSRWTKQLRLSCHLSFKVNWTLQIILSHQHNWALLWWVPISSRNSRFLLNFIQNIFSGDGKRYPLINLPYHRPLTKPLKKIYWSNRQSYIELPTYHTRKQSSKVIIRKYVQSDAIQTRPLQS